MRRILRDLSSGGHAILGSVSADVFYISSTLFFGVNERVRLRCDDDTLRMLLLSICLIERAAAWNNVNMGEFGIWVDILEPCTDVRLFSLVY